VKGNATAERIADAFEPAPWLRGPTRQTVLSSVWPTRYPPDLPPAECQEIALPGPERIGVLVTRAEGRPRGRLVLLHGLGGSAESRYMLRATVAAHRRGW
jgi:predicted alpha/beta-fold hydrolase